MVRKLPLACRLGAGLCALALLAPPAPARAAAATEPPAPTQPWRVELSFASGPGIDLRETARDTPAPEMDRGGTPPPAERTWKEQRASLALSRDLAERERAALRIGLQVGTTVGKYTADSPQLRLSETVRTERALLWGLSAAGEVRDSPRRGPFLRVQCAHSRAHAGEDAETLVSDNPNASADDRDARFSWRRTELSFGLGWRWGGFAPQAGVGYRRLTLEKRVQYHIPVPDTPVLLPFDFETARKLNSRESAFAFRNTYLWSPLLGFEWRPSDSSLVSAACSFAGFPECTLAAAASF